MRCLLLVLLSFPLAAFAQLKLVSETTFDGMTYAESIGCDPAHQAIYASEFGSKLAPLEKDGAGYISKWGLDGRLIEQHFLPAVGETLNKPKGIWVQGERLWTTDIDSVWVFDLKTRKGRKLALPGAQFANDPAIADGVLYVSDHRGDQLFRISPADFLDLKGEPKVTTVFQGAGVNPNGVWPGKGGLWIVGYASREEPRAIYRVGKDGKPTAVSDPIGALDGVAELEDGSLLVTDWNSGSLFQWSKQSGRHRLTEGFKGPADFCAIEHDKDVTVYVPDLVESKVRIVRLRK